MAKQVLDLYELYVLQTIYSSHVSPSVFQLSTRRATRRSRRDYKQEAMARNNQRSQSTIVDHVRSIHTTNTVSLFFIISMYVASIGFIDSDARKSKDI